MTADSCRPHYADHRQRLRERFARGGVQGMHDYEQLELLLAYAIPRRDVKPIAKDLLSHFGSLAAVLDASHEELIAVDGVGDYSATLLRLVKELCGAYLAEGLLARPRLDCAADVVDFARATLAGRPHEAFMALYLDTQNRVIGYELLTEGTVDRVVLFPRRLLEAALRRHAAALILVHNHPSGHCEPSPEDRDLTRNLQQTAAGLDIQVLDHLIVSRQGYHSFAEAGDL